ncbi:DUF5927 domain-containing protein [Paracoccus albicereus]
MLCHAALDLAARMARIWASGGAVVMIHVDSKASKNDVAKMRSALADLDTVRFSHRIACTWGDMSLVHATQNAARQLLDEWPDTTHVYLASGACLPLRPVSELRAYLAQDPTADHIESVDAREGRWTAGGFDMERFLLWFPVDWRRRRILFDRLVQVQRRLRIRRRLPAGLSPHLGSQWWCLTASTLRAILDDPRRSTFEAFFRFSWIPDESYFQSLARIHSIRIENHSLTLAKFDPFGRPYLLYDDHLQLLAESRCFVARKIWADARGLYAHFPATTDAGDGRDAATQPDSSLMASVFDRAVARRRLGRPGLYMQSRFPAKDRENGKTSAPYAVFQGFSDLFPQFEDWLATRIDADVHGHLLGPGEVEFSGRPEVGPGALSTHPVLRDHDPQGFLSALIRITRRMQAFQFSPRDNQALNWFIVTDPNARLMVVTGAWVVPLLQSDMPFDDIRRVAAQLQRIELDQQTALRSVWVKAQVRSWDLSEFLDDPERALKTAVQMADPRAEPGEDLPVMRDVAGLPDFLRRLRNAGLHQRVTGLFHERSDSSKGGGLG